MRLRHWKGLHFLAFSTCLSPAECVRDDDKLWEMLNSLVPRDEWFQGSPQIPLERSGVSDLETSHIFDARSGTRNFKDLDVTGSDQADAEVARSRLLQRVQGVLRSLRRSAPGWWFGTFFISHILGMSSPQLTFIFFRGVGIPPTRPGSTGGIGGELAGSVRFSESGWRQRMAPKLRRQRFCREKNIHRRGRSGEGEMFEKIVGRPKGHCNGTPGHLENGRFSTGTEYFKITKPTSPSAKLVRPSTT